MASIVTLVPNPALGSPALLTYSNFGFYRYSYNSKICSLMFPRFVSPKLAEQLPEKFFQASMPNPPAE